MDSGAGLDLIAAMNRDQESDWYGSVLARATVQGSEGSLEQRYGQLQIENEILQSQIDELLSGGGGLCGAMTHVNYWSGWVDVLFTHDPASEAVMDGFEGAMQVPNTYCYFKG